jgi:hypothetical protein
MVKIGDLVIVQLPDDDEMECLVKAVDGDHVQLEWPQDRDDGGWWTNVGMLTRNRDGTWNAMVPSRSEDIHPANRPGKGR